MINTFTVHLATGIDQHQLAEYLGGFSSIVVLDIDGVTHNRDVRTGDDRCPACTPTEASA